MGSPAIKVLMVDDDEDDFIIVRDLLRDAAAGEDRYELTWVPVYEQALCLACENRADVVLVDYRLGVHSGIQFVHDLANRRCLTPVILLTGQGDRAVDLAAMEAGAADFLNKSQLTADLLERAIRYAVAQRKAEEQRLSLLAERAARSELEAAAKAKDDFLAMLSHELRTPLTPVLLTVSHLQRDATLSAGVREQIADIRRNLEIQTKLVDDLLDLSRVSRGKFELVEALADVHELIEHAIQTSCSAEPKSRSMEIVRRPEARRHRVWGDQARLEQVLWNLIKNALKFTPEGGRIEIATENPTPAQIAIRVRDSGVGIEPANLKVIFNAFEQGGRDVTRQFGGLGLGLAICKAIVEMHGGTIEVESEGPGRGAVFTVVLPVTVASELPNAQEGPAERGEMMPLPHNPRVLLVEDNLVALKIMSRLFRDTGYEVTAAPDIATARDAVQANRFDLVVSDLGLPDGSGLDLMRLLRDEHGLRGIALSGYGQAQDVKDSLAAGFVEHLVKPVDFARLEAAVRRAFSRSTVG